MGKEPRNEGEHGDRWGEYITPGGGKLSERLNDADASSAKKRRFSGTENKRERESPFCQRSLDKQKKEQGKRYQPERGRRLTEKKPDAAQGIRRAGEEARQKEGYRTD